MFPVRETYCPFLGEYYPVRVIFGREDYRGRKKSGISFAPLGNGPSLLK